MKRNGVVFPSFSASRISVGGQHLGTKSLPAPVRKGAPIQVPGYAVRVKAELGWARNFLAGGCRVPSLRARTTRGLGSHTVRGPTQKGVCMEGLKASRN